MEQDGTSDECMQILAAKVALITAERPVEDELARNDGAALKDDGRLTRVLQVIDDQHGWIHILGHEAPGLFEPCEKRRIIQCPDRRVL